MKCTKIISVFSQGSASDPAAEATMLLWTSQSVGEGIPCPHSPPTQSMPGPVFKYDHLALLHTKKTISYRKQCLTAQTRNSRAGCFRSFARGSCLRDTSATAALHCADWLSRGTSCKAHTRPSTTTRTNIENFTPSTWSHRAPSATLTPSALSVPRQPRADHKIWPKGTETGVRSCKFFTHWPQSKVKYTDIAVRCLTCHTATGTHMPYRMTQCYLPPGRGDILTFTPAESGTRLSDPGGMQGWVKINS